MGISLHLPAGVNEALPRRPPHALLGCFSSAKFEKAPNWLGSVPNGPAAARLFICATGASTAEAAAHPAGLLLLGGFLHGGDGFLEVANALLDLPLGLVL